MSDNHISVYMAFGIIKPFQAIDIHKYDPYGRGHPYGKVFTVIQKAVSVFKSCHEILIAHQLQLFL